MIAKYTADLPAFDRAKAGVATGAPVVLLTGATGNIGSHILASLLSEGSISRIYTLDRPSADPAARLRASLEDRALPGKLLQDPRLVCLFGDINQDKFGLEASTYNEVRT